MSKLKLGIVEDELLIARSIKEALGELGYDYTEACISYTEALEMIEEEKPDMLLLDINLSGKKDGIDVAAHVNEKYHIPFIFLTANSDAATIDRAKKVKPHAYLVKPFSKEELFASIEIAFNNYSSKPQQEQSVAATKINNALFIRENHAFVKILFSEIVFIESQENYVQIHTTGKKRFMIRSTFTDFLEQLPKDLFFRTGRSHAVQLELVEKIEPTEVVIAGQKVPLSKTNRDELYQRLGIRE
jgi:DNA-binding LytR/AlgR family response regulator